MKNNFAYIPQNGVTIITPIDSSKDLKGLYSLLLAIGNDVNNQTIIDFKAMKRVHFLRWFIIENAVDRTGDNVPDSLVLATDFDGSIDDHLEELLGTSGIGIDKIYEYCNGYPKDGSKQTKKAIRYFKAHSRKNQLFWANLRGGTVEQILGEEKLYNAIQKFLDEQQAQDLLSGASPEQLKSKIQEFVAGTPELSWALTPKAKPDFRWKFNYYGTLVFRIAIFLLSLPLVLLFFVPVWWLILSRIFEKRDDKNRKEIRRSKEMEDLLEKEDHIYMNQFTIYGAIKKPYWYRLTTLKIGLWLFATNGGYRSTKGKLSGIESIHFARWCIFNGGKNVMFLSNYDGSWEIYLSEFIDRSAAAMNLTFGTTVGYPKVKYLFWEGAYDEQTFKQVVRNNQYPTQVFYSAYPYLTAKNQNNNAKIRTGLDETSKESIEEWLKRF